MALVSETCVIRFTDTSSPTLGIFLSVMIGAAAQLAAIDDAGRRELIGLAAASQVGMIPVWFGITVVSGFSRNIEMSEVASRAFSLFANALALIIAIGATQFLTGTVDEKP